MGRVLERGKTRMGSEEGRERMGREIKMGSEEGREREWEGRSGCGTRRNRVKSVSVKGNMVSLEEDKDGE